MTDIRQRNAPQSTQDIEMAPRMRGGAGPTHSTADGASAPAEKKKASRLPRGIHAAGESGRRGFHPLHFFRVCWRSSNTVSKYVNVLWPFVPVALALHFYERTSHREDLSLWTFSFNYIAMVPAANLIGFAGQQLAWKLPKVLGILLETLLGGIVEIILLCILVARPNVDPQQAVRVTRDAILGSILANLLLCLGFCFFVGGLRQHAQQFDPVVSEVGTGLLFTAGFALVIPTLFDYGISGVIQSGGVDPNGLNSDLELKLSRATAIVLWLAFILYVLFQMHTHHGLYDSILEQDEEKDLDRHKDLAKAKLTLTECFIAIALGITFASMHADFLVEEIEPIIEQHKVSEMFVGLILVPLVEKLAEHLTAIDEAWDNQMNFALAHVLGATLQTALFIAPLVVFVGWGQGRPMDFGFSSFQAVLLVLAIIGMGNFLRDGESNYLEGALCILIYVIIAIAAFYFPTSASTGHESEPAEPAASGEAVAHAAKLMARALVG